ncbi:MAG TPA: DNA-binding protein [Candidatus Lumbricidophila sp.]|nr:DNA-binding protein [Candidatus Lumbricidophila sp.]
MFVLTADQVGSRRHADVATAWVARLADLVGHALALPVGRASGDEIQIVTTDASAALTAAFALTRSNEWSVGIGIGAVRTPLPATANEATGPAFYAARNAVDRAKSAPYRFALAVDDPRLADEASDLEAMLTLALAVRAKRSDAGWAAYDLLAAGHTQREAARLLGISEPSVTDRVRAGLVRVELDASAALVRLLARVEQLATSDRSGDLQQGRAIEEA